MTIEEGGESPEKELPAKPVLNDCAAQAGDAEKRADAVRRDTGAIDADAAHDRSS
jgi:hypothetical protein